MLTVLHSANYYITNAHLSTIKLNINLSENEQCKLAAFCFGIYVYKNVSQKFASSSQLDFDVDFEN